MRSGRGPPLLSTAVGCSSAAGEAVVMFAAAFVATFAAYSYQPRANITVRSVPAAGPVGPPRPLAGAEVVEDCPGLGIRTLGRTGAHGELQLVEHLREGCALIARARGHEPQRAKPTADESVDPRFHSAVQFDLIATSDDALAQAVPANPQDVRVNVASDLDGVEVRYIEEERAALHLRAERVVCTTPCTWALLPVGKLLSLGRQDTTARLDAPVLVTGPSNLRITYQHHRYGRWLAKAATFAGLASMTVGGLAVTDTSGSGRQAGSPTGWALLGAGAIVYVVAALNVPDDKAQIVVFPEHE